MVKYEIAAVVAEFNYDITQMMLELAKAEAKNRDCEITKVVAVPGVFDMPLVIKKLLQKDQYDAIITLGAVIEGATDHDQIVAQHASRKIADLALEYDTPVALGITGPGMTRMDAHRRVKNAKSAVEAAIKMCDRLKEKFQDPWIAPYEKILTMVDGDKVELIEYHPCISGSHWLLNQYKKNSKLIDSAYRDGNKHVYNCHVGSAPLDLKASFNAAGIDEIIIDNDDVKITHAGLAGAGVGAGMCRGMGEGVKYIELLDIGGGSKVGRATVVTPKLEKIVIGIDDTDTKDAGATWTMAHNLGVELANQGYEYIDHIIVQLYPHNPHKTQNCVSIALTFAVEESKKQELIDKVIEILKRDTLSDKTAIAILEGLNIPEKLREYSIATKSGMMDVETAEKIAEDLNIPLIAVTGEQGKVGALAALGLYDDVEEAVKAYDK